MQGMNRLKLKIILFLICFLIISINGAVSPKPHIIVIVADDMGFNDVGSHGSDQIPTPNIDALASFGINLNRFYVSPMCSPSRSSLMTGKYPSNIGMHHYVIPSEQPWGLGLDHKILPEYMKDGGYSTYIIGKWHLGFYRKAYTPTYRGFDSHFGYLGPFIDYFNHSLTRKGLPYELENGYDMRKDENLHFDTKGIYATDLFTDVAVETINTHNKSTPMFLYLPHLAPHAANFYDVLQAPAEDIAKFDYIKDENRRKYAAMVSKLDDGIGKVVTALQDNAMLENSVILFFCDNGAPIVGEHHNSGSNFPFKGQKDSPWEGAVRSAAAIWSPHLHQLQRVSNDLIHISDWLPTFAHLAGIEINETLDGHNVWPSLSQGTANPRNELLCHMDNIIGYTSYIKDEWKYVNGSSYDGLYDDWLSDSNDVEKHPSFSTYGNSILSSEVGRALQPFSKNFKSGSVLAELEIEELRKDARITCNNVAIPAIDSEFVCNATKSPCLFNIINDPCERMNLASQRPNTLIVMQLRVNEFSQSMVPPRNRPSDPRSNPANFNNTWTWWYDELGISDDGYALRINGWKVLCMVIVIAAGTHVWYS